MRQILVRLYYDYVNFSVNDALISAQIELIPCFAEIETSRWNNILPLRASSCHRAFPLFSPNLREGTKARSLTKEI